MNEREFMVEFMLVCAGVTIFLVLLWRLTGTVIPSLVLLALALAFLYCRMMTRLNRIRSWNRRTRFDALTRANIRLCG